MKKLILTICILLAVTGCVTETASDGTKTVRIDAEKAEQFEQGAEAGISIMQALVVVWPGFAVLSATLAGVLGAWRTQKGKLIIAQSETKMYHSVTASLVGAIDDYREAYPANWGKLRTQLADTIGPEGENIIRALRDLPAKT